MLVTFIDAPILLHPFRPHEAAAMLPELTPGDRSLVYGIVGGMPQYLEWWDQGASITDNLRALAGRPGSLLLTEGERVLGTEIEAGDRPAAFLYALAAGRTRYQEIEDAIKAEPSRTLERLIKMRLVERQIPVTEDPVRTRRRIYRIADNFLAFYLGVLSHYQAEIDRGLGNTIVEALMSDLDGHMGAVFEEAFREHLRRLAVAGRLGRAVVGEPRSMWASVGRAIRFHHLHGAERQPVLKRSHDELGLGRIFLNEVRHGLQLLRRGRQLRAAAALGLSHHRVQISFSKSVDPS